MTPTDNREPRTENRERSSRMWVLRKDASSLPIAFLITMEHAKFLAKRLEMEVFEIMPVEVEFVEAPPMLRDIKQ